MQSSTAKEQYLRTIVLTASPAKLRYLLIERATALVDAIKEERMRVPDRLVNEKTVTLRDILGELLNGVQRAEDKLAATVADLYVFLIQELTYAEREPGTDRLDSIATILEIEKETWRQACESQAKSAAPAAVMGTGGPHLNATPSLTTHKSINFSA